MTLAETLAMTDDAVALADEACDVAHATMLRAIEQWKDLHLHTTLLKQVRDKVRDELEDQ